MSAVVLDRAAGLGLTLGGTRQLPSVAAASVYWDDGAVQSPRLRVAGALRFQKPAAANGAVSADAFVTADGAGMRVRRAAIIETGDAANQPLTVAGAPGYDTCVLGMRIADVGGGASAVTPDDPFADIIVVNGTLSAGKVSDASSLTIGVNVGDSVTPPPGADANGTLLLAGNLDVATSSAVDDHATADALVLRSDLGAGAGSDARVDAASGLTVLAKTLHVAPPGGDAAAEGAAHAPLTVVSANASGSAVTASGEYAAAAAALANAAAIAAVASAPVRLAVAGGVHQVAGAWYADDIGTEGAAYANVASLSGASALAHPTASTVTVGGGAGGATALTVNAAAASEPDAAALTAHVPTTATHLKANGGLQVTYNAAADTDALGPLAVRTQGETRMQLHDVGSGSPDWRLTVFNTLNVDAVSFGASGGGLILPTGSTLALETDSATEVNVKGQSVGPASAAVVPYVALDNSFAPLVAGATIAAIDGTLANLWTLTIPLASVNAMWRANLLARQGLTVAADAALAAMLPTCLLRLSGDAGARCHAIVHATHVSGDTFAVALSKRTAADSSAPVGSLSYPQQTGSGSTAFAAADAVDLLWRHGAAAVTRDSPYVERADAPGDVSALVADAPHLSLAPSGAAAMVSDEAEWPELKAHALASSGALYMRDDEGRVVAQITANGTDGLSVRLWDRNTLTWHSVGVVSTP